MAKINFTKEHFDKMCGGVLEMVLSNKTISTKMGTPLNAIELLHTTTIGTLNNIRVSLGKQIETLETQDEWVADGYSQSKLNDLKGMKETVNLIIGYKRYQLEKEETANKRRELEAKLSQLKESQKTPEDKIKEIENALSELDSTTF